MTIPKAPIGVLLPGHVDFGRPQFCLHLGQGAHGGGDVKAVRKRENAGEGACFMRRRSCPRSPTL